MTIVQPPCGSSSKTRVLPPLSSHPTGLPKSPPHSRSRSSNSCFKSESPCISLALSTSRISCHRDQPLHTLPDLIREDTRASRSSKLGPNYIAPGDEGAVKDVVVQIAPDGTTLTFPDGGRRAWLCVVGAAGALFCSLGLAASAGAFQTYYSTHQLSTYTQSEISWIGSVQIWMTFSTTAFTGSLFDLHGHKPLVVAGTLFLTFGYCMLSLSSKYYQIFLCQMVIAWGMNLLYITSVAVLGQWFSKRKGLAFGLSMAGAAIGSSVWPLLCANLPRRISFGWTMRLIALVCALLGTNAFFLLKTRLPPRPPGPLLYLVAFKSLPYCLTALASLVDAYGTAVGLGSFAPYLLVLCNVGSIGGRAMTGLIADRTGAFNSVMVSNLLMSLCFWAWLGCKAKRPLIAINVLFGFFSGGFVSLQAPMITRLAVDMRFGGTMVGQVLLVQSIAQLFAPPTSGALLGHGTPQQELPRFPHAIILGGLMMTLSSVCVAVARFRIERRLLAFV